MDLFYVSENRRMKKKKTLSTLEERLHMNAAAAEAVGGTSGKRGCWSCPVVNELR